tara:strand:- start:587 stop:1234 length:648 start_codon:yes stop_codon:yes gene_type:complete
MKNLNLIQLGTNSGKDHVNSFIGEYKDKIKEIVLVEPVPQCIPKIKQNYINHDIVIEPSAIIPKGRENTGTTNLYLVDYPEFDQSKWMNFEVSSLTKSWPKNKGLGWSEYGRSIEVETLYFEQLVSKYKLKTVDFLFMDVEGEDDAIIEGLDILKYNFKIVVWEKCSDGRHPNNILKFKNLGYEGLTAGANYIAFKPEYKSYIPNLSKWLTTNYL